MTPSSFEERFDEFVKPKTFCGGDHCSGLWNINCDDIGHNDGRKLVTANKAKEFTLSELDKRDGEWRDKIKKAIEESDLNYCGDECVEKALSNLLRSKTE